MFDPRTVHIARDVLLGAVVIGGVRGETRSRDEDDDDVPASSRGSPHRRTRARVARVGAGCHRRARVERDERAVGIRARVHRARRGGADSLPRTQGRRRGEHVERATRLRQRVASEERGGLLDVWVDWEFYCFEWRARGVAVDFLCKDERRTR